MTTRFAENPPEEVKMQKNTFFTVTPYKMDKMGIFFKIQKP